MATLRPDARSREVFVNCPFDERYQPLFYATIFCLHDCGFLARTALETDDSSQVRLEKICRIIEECDLGVHDISRTDPDEDSGLPRFNMPLELGLFLGAKRFGGDVQSQKQCLILSSEQYTYQQYISDIAGQDIRAHGGDVNALIRVIRNWCGHFVEEVLPGASRINSRFRDFLEYLEDMIVELGINEEHFTYSDYTTLVVYSLMDNPR